jgi:hypothetical protein
MTNSERLYQLLLESSFVGAKGEASFTLQNLTTPIQDKSVFGNLIQEWLKVFMQQNQTPYRLVANTQAFPDFLMHATSDEEDLLEVKCFTKSPNFDVANFQAYARSLLENPYRLNAHYLLIEYTALDEGLVIENLWLKKVWEITGGSERAAVKIQWKQGNPVNIRPSVWYSTSTQYPSFTSRKEFVQALKAVIDTTPACSNIQRDWFKKVSQKYEEQTGCVL